VSADDRGGRRQFLGLAVGLGVAGCASAPHILGGSNEDVGPAEDLMREHGVLNRVLLVYEECRLRLDLRKSEIPPGVLEDTAKLVQQFIHDYHETLEEGEVFPRLEEANELANLTRVLRTQHAAGRAITARILDLSAQGPTISDAGRTELSTRLTDFVRMYRPHEAREDTVVFPAFHKLFTPREWDALGDRFEGQEREKVGEEGFEHAVVRVATIEHALQIDELSRFTPQV
jgi:hemerythrin-like domain-containing protein